MTTPERIAELSRLAYKLAGYETAEMPDGTLRVKASPRVVHLMNTFQSLITQELEQPTKP